MQGMFHVKHPSVVFHVKHSRHTGYVRTTMPLDAGTNKKEERPICDYEGSGYKQDFWIGQGREYEDLAERVALRRLLPKSGQRLLEIGAGFGRLAGLYDDFDEVVLLDYSRSLLRDAQATWGHDQRFTFVSADLYDLPFCAGQFDAIVMVRVAHHLVDVPSALRGVRQALVDGGCLIIEYANKRNLKAMARYLFRRQRWNPLSPEPHEFVGMNFNFHPKWMRAQLREAGFSVERSLTVSHFRLEALKRRLPAGLLARLDGLLQPTGALWTLTPSVILRARPAGAPNAPSGLLFRCLDCGDTGLDHSPHGLTCPRCGRSWPMRDGIYDFKSP